MINDKEAKEIPIASTEQTKNRILRCCSNESRYKITYVTGTQYFVCDTCAIKPHWRNGIKTINEIG